MYFGGYELEGIERSVLTTHLFVLPISLSSIVGVLVGGPSPSLLRYSHFKGKVALARAPHSVSGDPAPHPHSRATDTDALSRHRVVRPLPQPNACIREQPEMFDGVLFATGVLSIWPFVQDTGVSARLQ